MNTESTGTPAKPQNVKTPKEQSELLLLDILSGKKKVEATLHNWTARYDHDANGLMSVLVDGHVILDAPHPKYGSAIWVSANVSEYYQLDSMVMTHKGLYRLGTTERGDLTFLRLEKLLKKSGLL